MKTQTPEIIKNDNKLETIDLLSKGQEEYINVLCNNAMNYLISSGVDIFDVQEKILKNADLKDLNEQWENIIKNISYSIKIKSQITRSLLLTGCILYIMKKNQGKNIYEISNSIFGKIISKVMMIIIAIWMLILITSRINVYVFTIQLTMMPNTRAYVFILTMFALVLYAISKGMKTVCRISEFSLGMIILIIIFFIIFSLSNIKVDYILPKNIFSTNISRNAINNIVFMGTNIVNIWYCYIYNYLLHW